MGCRSFSRKIRVGERRPRRAAHRPVHVLLPVRGFELSPRSRFGDDLLVEPSHGVDSERGEIEIDRLYPELAHGAQVVDDFGVAAGEQDRSPLSAFAGAEAPWRWTRKASATLAGSRPTSAASLRRRSTAARYVDAARLGIYGTSYGGATV